ncbi:MAG: hypothetical protein IKL48_00535 [Elusimicrobiaceae bacterium]|nr:hypothetical protein [Elusimicrobiaceae bacterium]
MKMKIFSKEKQGFYSVYKILGIKIKIFSLKRFLKKQTQFFEQTEKLAQEIINLKTMIRVQTVHSASFAPYQNKHLGQTITLIASGPSVKQFKPFIKDSVYVAVNNSCSYDQVDFDYLFLQEQHHDAQKNVIANKYKGKKCQKFYGILPENRLKTVYPYIKLIPQGDIKDQTIKRYYLEDKVSHQFASDLITQPIGDFQGTVFSAMQFIFWTHPKTIYLVGCDCGTGNFTGTMAGDCSVQKDSWIALKKWAEETYPDVEIISVNPVGLKGLFKDLYQEK